MSTPSSSGLQFTEEDHRVDDHAVADQVLRARAEHAAGDGVQDMLAPFEGRVCPALGPPWNGRDHLVVGRDHVNDLALAPRRPIGRPGARPPAVACVQARTRARASSTLSVMVKTESSLVTRKS